MFTMRILIADDDGISRHFLSEACRAIGCEPVAVDDGAQALAVATSAQFDVLVLDLRMPHMGGAELLGALRARGVNTRAIATSADMTNSARERLLQHGFCDALSKPVSVDRFAEAIRAQAVTTSKTSHADDGRLLEDASALASVGGDWSTLRALRQLLAQELAIVVEELGADVDRSRMLDRLHRLRASCGFCGAVSVTNAAQEFQRALEGKTDRLSAARENFVRACDATRIALLQSE
jgi:CheY-like chemotaxis protein